VSKSAANGAFSMIRLRLFVLPVLAVALLAAGCGGSSDQSASLGTDDVAAVGSQQITKAQFKALMARAEKSYAAQKRTFPKAGTSEYNNLQGQAVDFLVQRAEFENEANNMGIHISDKQVDDRINKLIKQFYSGSEKKYEQTIKAQGLNKDTARDEVRAQLVSEELYKKVTSDVNVSDKQIKDYYDANKSIYVQKQSRDVRHILVTKKALADQLYAQLKSGGNFAQLAKKYSKDPGSAQNGGKLTITRGQTVPQFDKTAFALSSIRPAKTTPLDKVKASIRQQLEQQKKQDEMTKWVDDLKKKFCGGSRIKYQVGYTPNPDPCAAILSNTGSTSTAGQ
jgi:parvulin-like peptidyl-prolyl isomerase